MIRASCLLLLAAHLLAGCSIPAAAPPRSGGSPGAGSVSLPPPAIAATHADRQCLAKLGESGATFTPLPDRYHAEGCAILGAVQLHALSSDLAQLQVRNLGPVSCPVSTAFAAWARFGVDRAARQILGSPLASIQTMGSYACRNVAGTTRRSAHATGEAIDVSGFVLEDGRRITLTEGWNGSAAERRFLRTVMQSACRRFRVVLGPDYNAAHRDHFHLEGVAEGSSFCR